MSDLEKVTCNLCGCGESRVLYDRPYRIDTLSEAGTFAATTDEFQSYGTIVECSGCGLVFTNPRPTKDDLLKGYAEYVDELYNQEGSSRSINAHLSLATIKRYKTGGKLLEVGTSSGYFLNAARVDFSVEGLEPSHWAAKHARERYRLDVYAESLESTTRFQAGTFDVVAMIDVIEHVTDPLGFLKRGAELLKPGGVLYLVTPDVGSLSARILRGSWWGLRPAHIYYFDRSTMSAMLDRAGLETKLVKSFGRIFTWGYWASRLRHYPAFIHEPVFALIKALGIESKFLYIDTRDSMEIVAVKR
jgi:2-polyprenyl-3-methyl-5-hydroxy-6-metoxy-1,4-benzoquinol methylase